MEKLPFFAASLAVSVVTYLVHREAGATASLSLIPPVVRFENALVSYVAYIFQMFWPVDLAVFYPYPLGSLAIPAHPRRASPWSLITARAIRVYPRFPYLAIGWLWYLIMLLPVIGLIQVGAQARADRYTYLPMLGLSIALVWGAADVLRAGRASNKRPPPPSASRASSSPSGRSQSGATASRSTSTPSTSQRTTTSPATTSPPSTETRGQLDDAAAQLRETIRVRPLFIPAHAALGQVLAKQGRPTEAAPEFAAVLRTQPDNADIRYNYGLALAQSGNIPDAAREFRATVALRPADVEARFNLAIALSTLGQRDEAITHLTEVLRLKPDFAPAREELDALRRK